MRLVYISSSLIALVLSGVYLQASAAISILDDPVCVKTLMPEEIRGLKLCVERGATCTRYWPNQKNDLQKCDAAASWIRTAKTWPLTQRNEVFGPEWPPESVSGLSSPEPAWKKLPRSGNPSVTPQLNIPDNASADPYAGTSAAITPEAAKRAGWNVGALTGAVNAAGRIVQDNAAIEDPESSMAAKEVLGSMGLAEYSASDEAIVNGRKAEAAAYAEAQLEHPSTTTAATASPSPAATSPAVTTTSRNPYENNTPTTTSSYPGADSGISEPQLSQAQSQRLPYKANANSCIGLRGNNLVNYCSRDVWITFCVLNPRQTSNFFDSSDAFQCPKGGLDSISGYKVYGLVLHGMIQFFACYADDIGTMKTNFHGVEPLPAAPGTLQGSYTGSYHGLCAGPGADGRLDGGSSVYAN